ncbi:MAG: FAD-dependent oxidoreductase [Chloroflexi bacterium]|nr:FAD-dependent oxidoreductase [Chloroflexota bacterium]
MTTINLTINDRPVRAREGATVLEAAREAGIYIPTLCYHPALKPSGACRLCVVEIEKMRGFTTSCTTPAAGGMVVRTETPQLQDLRRGILELILTEHPHPCLSCHRRHRCQPTDICLRSDAVTERCVTCAKNGRCELQQLSDYIGFDEMTLEYRYRGLPVEGKDPLLDRDYNLCVLCGRCVQMCQDARGIGAISFVNRGSATVVGTAFDRPLKDAGCRFCGACIEVCPTGALMDRETRLNPDADLEKTAVPCRRACPAGIDIPLYVDLISRGKFQDSLAIVREKVPFPGTLGRVCIHPCEEACRRGELNQPIAIKFLKRFVADRDTGAWKKYARRLPPTGKRAAVVGSGPAGLTAAYYLGELGHAVTVFEALPEAGGMMRVGIPDYRLPKDVLKKEITDILETGVELKLNTRIESLDALFRQGYDAVFLAVGAHRGMKLGIEGEDSPGVVDGAAFLRSVSLGEKVDLGRQVAVIGGGNAAIDSARTARRLGAAKVSVIYRRTRAEMPASPEEVEGALEEGIEIIFLVAPLKIGRKDGRLALTCQRMALGAPDTSGRARPVPVKGSDFTLEFDAIIAAIGQSPLIPGFDVRTGRGSLILVDDCLATSRQGVWAGGDVATGPASVIEAIAAGRRAASEMDRYLGGKGHIDEELTAERQTPMHAGKDGEFAGRERVAMPCLAPADRQGFVEVELGYDEQAAIAEARRCCQCGIRTQIPPAPCAPARARACPPVPEPASH